MVWEKVTTLMRSTLLFEPERTREHNKGTLQELQKLSHELDMQVISFIVTCLLPNSTNVQNLPGYDSQRTFEHSLISIIDSGCLTSAAASSNTNSMSSLSRYCFNNMFELCRYKEEEENKEGQVKRQIEIRQKIARIATPILINRCR